MATTYCDSDDLLLGDLVVGQTVSLDQYVSIAADEMNARLGFLYTIPIEPNDPPYTELLEHERLLLKDINAKLASGRLLLAQAQGSEDTSEHAYGASLLRDAWNSLNLITTREVILSSALPAPDTVLVSYDSGPSIQNEDEESLVLGFENTVLRSVPWRTRPGKVS